jgi:aryl-alcohol dehydrogenase-like predicted oxidoreductase
MQKRKLGRDGPEISVVGYGAWEAGGGPWGPNPPEAEVIGAIRASLDAGTNWIDTAEVYGRGTSERIVGRAIEGRRDGVVVATKVAPKPFGSGFRADDVRRACEQSRERLGIDVIDLYQLHWTDRKVPVEETWEAMTSLVEDGVVRAIGVSNFREELIERCERIRHVDSLQPHFSMLHPGNRDLIRWCGERGIGVVTYGSLAYGLLTGAIDEDTNFDDWRAGRGESDYYEAMFAPGKIERSLAVVDGLRPIAERIGVTIAQLALAWTFHQPGVTSAISGTRNPGHARESAEAGAVELDDAVLEEIERLIPLGPDFGDSG